MRLLRDDSTLTAANVTQHGSYQRVPRHAPLRAAAVTTLVTTLGVTGPPTDPAQAAKLALRRVARRHQQMSEVIKQATRISGCS